MTYIPRKFNNTITKPNRPAESSNLLFQISPVNMIPPRRPPNSNVTHRDPIYNQYTGFIISLATTMKRIEPFFELIDSIESIDRVFKVVINLCRVYKRFQIELSERDLASVKNHPFLLRLNAKHGYEKYVLNIVDDWGPITKLTGVYEYVTEHGYTESKIVIMDDDTEYLDNCLSELVRYKTPRNIVAISGFLFYNRKQYTVIDEIGSQRGTRNRADIVEGFSGICFQYRDLDDTFMRFIRYYRTIDWSVKPNDASAEYRHRINTFLKACFLGDDFVISYYFGKTRQLYKVYGYLDSIRQQEFGYGSDALHQNTVFQSNNGTYAYIYDNIHLYELLLKHIALCRDIRELGSFQLRSRRR